jgi:nucleobase:cation symporter-1, NCS1 family
MTNLADSRVGVVESRGITPVPDERRHGRPSALFWMWFGTNMGILSVTVGAVLVSLDGLSLPQVLAATLIGVGGSFLLVAALSLVGHRSGAPAMTASRATFGQRGNTGPAIVAWINYVGWETVTCITASYALVALATRALGIRPQPAVIAVALLLCVLIEGVISILGHATILWLQRWMTWIFGLLTLPVCWFLVRTSDWHAIIGGHSASLPAVVAATGFIAAFSGISWITAGPDYTRYLPRDTRPRAIIWFSTAGATLPLVVVILVGALLATRVHDLATASNPIAAIGAPLPSWMLIPYLIVAFVGIICGADLTLYSSGLSLMAAGLKVKRPVAVLIDAVLIAGGGLYITIGANDFINPFTAFLTALAVPLMAWAGTFALDMVRRRGFDHGALLRRSAGSRYWYTGGVRLAAVVSWVAGIAAGASVTSLTLTSHLTISGPFAASWLGRNNLGWLFAGVAAGILYLCLDRIGAAKPATAPEPRPVPEPDRQPLPQGVKL